MADILTLNLDRRIFEAQTPLFLLLLPMATTVSGSYSAVPTDKTSKNFCLSELKNSRSCRLQRGRRSLVDRTVAYLAGFCASMFLTSLAQKRNI
jgi:hypothetical protein